MSELIAFSDSIVKLVEAASPAIVAIKAGAYRTVSGVAMDSDHIAVPDHALKRRDSFPFVTKHGDDAVAKVLGRDPGIDLAILHCKGHKAATLEAAPAGSLKAGMLTAVIGMTWDVGPSVSLGILGAIGPRRNTWRGGTLDEFLRLDVNLYPSQNGAAVISAEGKLIGIATPALSRHSTITLPVATIHRVIAELHKEGRIRTGSLGVSIQPVAIPQHLQDKLPGAPKSGLILLNVVSGGAADQAHLQVGDILVSMNGRSLEDVDQLQAQLRSEYIGKPSELLILRGGEPLTLSVIIQESERKQS